MTNVFAQNNSKTNYEILVCDFVQYCSNPIVMNLTLTHPDEISQKTTVDVQKSTNSTNTGGCFKHICHDYARFV